MTKRKRKIILVPVFIFLLYITWILFGTMIGLLLYRYDGYDCSDMSKEHKEFFESLGFNVKQKHGFYETTYYIESSNYHFYRSVGHTWLEIEILPHVWLPWESTRFCFYPVEQLYGVF